MRPVSRPLSAFAASAVALTVGAAGLAVSVPAAAHEAGQFGDLAFRQSLAGPAVPSQTSARVKPVASVPGSTGISACFLQSRPLMVMSNLDSVKVLDVSTPTDPRVVGTLPSVQFENEAMTCGERRTKDGVRRFALIGVDLYQVSPPPLESPQDLQHSSRPNVGGNELVVVDVTRPRSPRILSRTPGLSSTHTVACIDESDCRYAYSAGDSSDGAFSIFDLRRLGAPREIDADPTTAGVQPFTSPTAGHKWNFDEAGFGTHTGFDGASMWDVSRPRDPQLVTTTGAAGAGDDPRYPGWNDFILHNSFRPNADRFAPRTRPSVDDGNVLLVTEEDYEQTDCSKAGSFQTWRVRSLNGRADQIRPLDKVELSDLGTFPSPVGAFCSSHWFDFHRSGIVAVGFYGGGTQFLDVRDPRDIRSWGFAYGGTSEVWDSMWLPRYTDRGRQTGRETNLAYSIDAVRGLDVYRVALPRR